MSELAILGGPKTRTEAYPAWPVWDQRDIDAVTEVVKSGRWGGYPYPGPKTAELARKFAELQGGGYAEHQLVSVTSDGVTTPIGGPLLSVQLDPGSGQRLVFEMKRYANTPTILHPWQRQAVARGL